MKKVFSILICLLLVFGSLPTFAEGEVVTGSLSELDSQEYLESNGDTTLFVKIFEPETSYITTSAIVTIKVNNSDYNKVEKSGEEIKADNIIRMTVPKNGPKTISITMEGSTDEVINHMLTADETAYGYFMTVTANTTETFVSEEAFLLEKVYDFDVLSVEFLKNSGYNDELINQLESIGKLEFSENQTEYFIDMPIDTNLVQDISTYLALKKADDSGGTVNAIKSIQITNVTTNGSSGLSNGIVEYKSGSGYIRYNVMVSYFDSADTIKEKIIYINAYHDFFVGLRFDTSQVVGNWTHGDQQAYSGNGEYFINKDVYVSANHAIVSFSDTNYNIFSDLAKVDDDSRIIDLDNGSFKLMLDGIDTAFSFTLAGKNKITDEDVVFNIEISKKVVSMGRVTDSNSNIEDAYVYYQPDDSFPMINPKALAMLYYDVPNTDEFGMSRTRVLVETRVIDFKTLDEAGLSWMNTNELVAYIGPIDVTDRSYGVPTMTTVFLIEGDVSLESDTFGGVKYGIGDGWNGVFGNYQW